MVVVIILWYNIKASYGHASCHPLDSCYVLFLRVRTPVCLCVAICMIMSSVVWYEMEECKGWWRTLQCKSHLLHEQLTRVSQAQWLCGQTSRIRSWSRIQLLLEKINVFSYFIRLLLIIIIILYNKSVATVVPIHGKTTDGNMHIFNVPLYYFTPQHASTTASNFSTNSRATE